jgi:protein-S-isoprenylcysteine O-methyltransferase Ste14
MSMFKLIVGVVCNVAIFGGFLFLPAGTLDWWRAWVFLGVMFVGTVASTVSVFRVNKDVLEERFKPPVQQGQPLADKVVVVLLIAAFVSVIVFIPLDVFRFHLMAKPGTLASSLGLVLFVVGWWIMTLALRENAFAAPVVKHQEARQHKVIDSGVYGVVRHPMYAGAVPCWSACRCGWNRTPRLCWPALPSGRSWCGSWSRNSSFDENWRATTPIRRESGTG